MNYDFIEIGTSCFETLLEAAQPGEVGLSVEPLMFYLERLPDKPDCRKIPLAISMTNETSLSKVYYVPEDVIQKRSLPSWLLGCNSMGEPHYQHRILNLLDVVKTYDVLSVPIGYLFEQYQVESVKTLKIDTEGCDAAILLRLHEYILAKGKFRQWPKTIRFESNALVPTRQVNEVIQRYTAIGYVVTQSTGHDTVMSR